MGQVQKKGPHKLKPAIYKLVPLPKGRYAVVDENEEIVAEGNNFQAAMNAAFKHLRGEN